MHGTTDNVFMVLHNCLFQRRTLTRNNSLNKSTRRRKSVLLRRLYRNATTSTCRCSPRRRLNVYRSTDPTIMQLNS